MVEFDIIIIIIIIIITCNWIHNGDGPLKDYLHTFCSNKFKN
jgi:hypothetical protein